MKTNRDREIGCLSTLMTGVAVIAGLALLIAVLTANRVTVTEIQIRTLQNTERGPEERFRKRQYAEGRE